MAASGIRKSPYEPGLYFVSPEPGTTLQDHSTQWQVRRNRCFGATQAPVAPLARRPDSGLGRSSAGGGRLACSPCVRPAATAGAQL